MDCMVIGPSASLSPCCVCRQEALQHKAVEDVHGLLQLPARGGHVDEKIFCMHGGLSPDLQSMEQVRRIMRPTDVPDQGLLCDLLWSDPDKDIMGWGENDRGVSFTFGADVVAKFLHKHDLDLICRAHQVVEDGYEFFAKRQLVTLFSAPNYCGEFDNAGAMMSVDETLMCSFQILKPADKKKFPYGGIAAGGKAPAAPRQEDVRQRIYLSGRKQAWQACLCGRRVGYRLTKTKTTGPRARQGLARIPPRIGRHTQTTLAPLSCVPHH
ncbi:hypothetical protein HPB48_026316 [Haemaphysalis longicornis]|uniref:protein-serine/threonine phosphatase n=1 Tax=Haemaphysalis longicornis TaxID=44386 RepID=A0A9J6H9B6_HAELO|nr:hypothetical protein HPB48_026316 [Haemaphysalis longicornis]